MRQSDKRALFVFGIMIAVELGFSVANARWENVAQLWPKDMPQSTKEWFSKQRSKYGNCCSLSDGMPADWDLKEGHYRVLDVVSFEQPFWRDVPEDAMIRGERNPTGGAVIWYMSSKDAQGRFSIRCFISGSEN